MTNKELNKSRKLKIKRAIYIYIIQALSTPTKVVTVSKSSNRVDNKINIRFGEVSRRRKYSVICKLCD